MARPNTKKPLRRRQTASTAAAMEANQTSSKSTKSSTPNFLTASFWRTCRLVLAYTLLRFGWNYWRQNPSTPSSSKASLSSSLPSSSSSSSSLSSSLEEKNDEVVTVHSHMPRLPPIPYKRWTVPCGKSYDPLVMGCHGPPCGRVLVDHFVSFGEVVALQIIAEKGMAGRSRWGGPTIMDINSGFVKDGDGLINLYRQTPPTHALTPLHFALYKRVIESIRLTVMQQFSLSTLYFTGPTFITRLVGNSSWSPKDMHDEYWHPHVDKANTPHYDYSGLLYLSDYELDFTGGLFTFIDAEGFNTVAPARGRLLTFTAGDENLHQAQQVETGTRYVMSMWFTCNKARELPNFLDGKAHAMYQE